MSQKKHKKRHPQQKRNAASTPAMESEFASDGRRKRMNRTARNLLLLSLVLVAAVNLLVNMGMMGQAMANVLSLVGIILLVLALWFQFRDPTGGGQSGVNAPRLRYRGRSRRPLGSFSFYSCVFGENRL